MKKIIDHWVPIAIMMVFGMFVGHIAYVIYKGMGNDKEQVRAAIYERGYLDGTIAGGKVVASDSLLFSDWLEMKKQDSIKVIIEYKGL